MFTVEDFQAYLKVKAVMIGVDSEVSQTEPQASLIGKRVIVRSRMAGVMYGTLVSIEGQTVKLKNARNIYRWRNKNRGPSLNDTAMEGLDRDYTKLSRFVPHIEMLEACSVLSVSNIAQDSLDNLDSYVEEG